LHVPGAAIAIVRGEEVIFARGFGVADIDTNTPVTQETPFIVASTTEAFTATLVGINIDGFAPAGAISSTVLDMTAWLRFLPRQGVVDGKALILTATILCQRLRVKCRRYATVSK
jgi:CubicO group peptidase (beta-lactamase class C family)